MTRIEEKNYNRLEKLAVIGSDYDNQGSWYRIIYVPETAILNHMTSIDSLDYYRNSDEYRVIKGFWQKTLQVPDAKNEARFGDTGTGKTSFRNMVYSRSLDFSVADLKRNSDTKLIVKLDTQTKMNIINSHILNGEVNVNESPMPPELGQSFLENRWGSVEDAVSWYNKKKMVDGLE